MSRTRILIRHAHRVTDDKSENNGLSKKGVEQCYELIEFLKRAKLMDKIERILSSPKLRCLETAFPIGKMIGQIPMVDPRLDEQSPKESDSDFEERLLGFWNEMGQTEGLCLVTHGDVIPRFAAFEGLQVLKVKKGQLLVLENSKIRYLNPLKVLESKA